MTKSYKVLKELTRGTNVPSTELALAIYSIKYLSEQTNHFSHKLDLQALIQNPSSVKEKLIEMFRLIENEFPDFNNVYSCLEIPWNIVENKLLFDIFLTLENDHELNYSLLINEIQTDIGLNHRRDLATHTTPLFIQELMISLLNIQNESSFYDGTAGFGGLLIEADHQNKNKNINFFGQEFNPNAWAMGKLLLLLSGIKNVQYAYGNTINHPAFFEDKQLKRFDYIAMSMPFGVSLYPNEKEQIENDPYDRFIYGRVPQKNADMAYVQHALSSSTGKGRVVLLVTNGTLFRGGSEAAIRKTLIDMDQIESIISLSENVLYHTAIPINILVLNKNKSLDKKGKIQFIKADHLFKSRKKQKYLTQEHIEEIVDLVENPNDQESFSKTINTSYVGDNLLVSKHIKNDKAVIEGEGTYKILFDKLENDSSHTLKFGEIGKLYKGLNTTPQNSSEEKNGKFKIIKMSDVHDGKIQVEKLSNISFKANMKIDPYVVKEGDILISSRGHAQKVAVVPSHDGTLVLSHNFIAIRPNKDIVDSGFLQMYLDSPVGRFTLSDLASGTSLPVLSAKDLETAALYLPKLSVQQSVVNIYRNAQRDYEEQLKKAQYQLKTAKDLAYKDSGLTSLFELIE